MPLAGLRAARRVLGLLTPLVLLGVGLDARAASLPAVPCAGSVASPPYAEAGDAPIVGVWHDKDLPSGWQAPSCVGWSAGPSSAVIALAGTFRFAGTADDLLTGFGAISTLPGMRYWSVGDGKWRELIVDAAALENGKSPRHRPDFAAAEMRSGQDLYFRQSDSRSSSAVTYRMRVLEATPDRVVVEMENVSPVKLLLFSVYGSGDLKATYFLDRIDATRWRFYSLSSVHETGIGGLGGSHDGSYVNRAVAFYRHIAGIPTDQEPPMARQ